jgi:hypothetical protein
MSAKKSTPATPPAVNQETGNPPVKQMTPKSIHKCPKCKAEIHHKAKTCPSCKATFATEEHIVEKKQSPAVKKAKDNSGGPNKKELNAKIKQLEAKVLDLEKQKSPPEVDRYALYQDLKKRGFAIKAISDRLDPDAEPELKAPKELDPLLKLVKFDNDNSGGGVRCVSTTDKFKFELDLDTLMDLLNIAPRK